MFFAGKAVTVVSVGIRCGLHSRVFVGVDTLAKMNRVFKFLAENAFARVPGHFE